jgi:hypothetical protein
VVDLEDNASLTPLNETPATPVDEVILTYYDEAIETGHEDDITVQGGDIVSAEMADGTEQRQRLLSGNPVDTELVLISKSTDTDFVAEEAQEAASVKSKFGLESS